MTVKLDFILDDLAKDKGEELFVVCRLMDVLPETLKHASYQLIVGSLMMG